ncbi:MAG TPA: CPBP family intramembrane metalloprotease [Firmicutes bacterium]|nr:CPBP family intramembrane metalloprotease [Bacillota bacterium]
MIISLLTAFALPVLIWFLWYKIAGYNQNTLLIAQLAIFLGAAVLAVTFSRDIGQLGLNGSNLLKALAVLLFSYVIIYAAGFLVNYVLATDVALLRQNYSWSGFLDNWLLTGFGEELLFAGVLFSLVSKKMSGKKRWLCILIVALLFALWHLPGYIATGRQIGSIIGRLALNTVSWIIFGAIYALSGNLWLVAMAHGSTDYPLVPLITNQPVFGVIFMALLVAGAWFTNRSAVGKSLK